MVSRLSKLIGRPLGRGIKCGLSGLALSVASPLLAGASAASAHELLQLGASYQGDLMSTWGNGTNGRGRALDSLHVTADSNLSSILPWDGFILHADVNMTSGAAPNEDAATLQGVDNIEVERGRTRLYEVWAEQSLFGDKASLRAGFQELNSDFYATESAGLLMNPSFGLSPELGATGSNGASTYPSTALGLRGFIALSDSVEMNVAAFNADALAVGDPGGPDTAFNNGALVIGQLNWTGPFKLGIGAWSYTDAQADIRDLDVNGDPVMQDAQGAYVMAEKALLGKEGQRRTIGFVRGGISDGNTTQFRGAWQAGVLVEKPLSFRPDGAATAGIAQALTSSKSRANDRDVGIDAARSETVLEFAYSDKILPWVSIQPDVQFALNPGGDNARENTFTAGLRLTIEPWSGE